MPKMPSRGPKGKAVAGPLLRKTKVQVVPNGPQVDGFKIPIAESSERWSEYTLEDGTIIRIKQVVFEMIRLADQYDPEGNPMYVTKATPILNIVSVPDNLKKK